MKNTILLTFALFLFSCSTPKYQPVLDEITELYKLSLAGVEYYKSVNAELMELISKQQTSEVRDNQGFQAMAEEMKSIRIKIDEINTCNNKMLAETEALKLKFEEMAEDLSDSEKNELVKALFVELSTNFVFDEKSIQEYKNWCGL